LPFASLVVFSPFAWRLTHTLAKGSDEAGSRTKASHRGDLLHGPGVAFEYLLGTIHALIEQVLVWRLAGDGAEVSREVKWT
jgi:hypothetical protein